MTRGRRDYRSSAGRMKFRKVRAGHVGHQHFHFKRDSLLERSEKLIKTMSNPSATLRASAKQTLTELISSREGHLSKIRTQMLAGKTKEELGERKLAKLHLIEEEIAEVKAVKELFRKAKARLGKI